MGKFYISAPIDEFALADEVAPAVARLAGGLPSAHELRELAREKSLDYATMCLYRALLASARDKAFIDAVDGEAIQTTHAPLDAKILFIPALFHAHYPETGADAALPKTIARNCGFEVDTIPIKSVGTITENADIIKQFLEREQARNIWVFCSSKGSADFRAFLQRHPDSPAVAKLRGWINACGLPNGCDIGDHNIATAWRRLKYRAVCRLFGTSYELMRELGTRHPYWREPLRLPPHMRVFNFVAIPLGAHIQKALIGRYLAIRHVGPNDGMVACRASIIEAGPTYPVWGCDHFFRGPQVVSILYRFFGFLRKQ